MRSHWKFFLTVEALLIIWFFYQVTTNLFVALLAIVGVIILVTTSQSKKENKVPSYLVGIFLLLFAVVSTSAFWFILLFTFLFIGIKDNGAFMNNLSGKLFKKAPWNEKEIIVVETAEQTIKNGKRKKQDWLGHQKIGQSIFEWDDINLHVLMGDTIVDLGNTFLPKSESYIVIRKGFGKTRILVPSGVGVMIEHSAIKGKVLFEGEELSLVNESVKMYSKDYDHHNRKLKVITSVGVGDLEVIAI